MDASRKRAALFEYFKSINNPKWVNNGDKLFKTLSDMKDVQVDSMYQRMLQLKERSEALKKSKETPMYKRWKMPLFMLLVWGGFGIANARSGAHDIVTCMLQAFIAGSYFEELFSNLIFNYIERKYSKGDGSV